VLVAAALAGAVPVASAQAPSVAEDRAAIDALLRERARAVMEGDLEAFMDTVSSRASAEFIALQARSFRGFRRLPLASFRYRVAWERVGDMARASDVARYPGVETVVIPVTEERYRIRGFDRRDAVEDFYYTYVKEDGEWLIASDTDLDDITLYSARHLWDTGPVEALSSEHFLLLQHPCSRERCISLDDEFLELAEAGLERADRYWSGRWDRRVVVLVPRNGAELERMIQSTFDLTDFVAFAYSTVDLTKGVDYTGHRIIPNPRAFTDRPADSVLQILSHELLHIATREASGPFVPVFVDEGFAEHAGHDADPSSLAFFDADVAAGLFDGRLPDDYQFIVGDGTAIFRSYKKAQSAVSFFIERFGLEMFNRFYRTLGRIEIEAGTTRYHLNRAFKATTGMSLEDFRGTWASSIPA
jgi:hypothetical protein